MMIINLDLHSLIRNKLVFDKFYVDLARKSFVKLFLFHEVWNASDNSFEKLSSFYFYFLGWFLV